MKIKVSNYGHVEIKDENGLELAKKLNIQALAIKVDGKILDINSPLYDVESIEFVESSSKEGKDIIRHSSAHLMAQAIQRLFPNTKKAIGPTTEYGFYYDFESDHKFSNEDLKDIEKEMNKIIKEKLPILKKILTKDEAINLFKKLNENYKVEIIQNIEGSDVVTIYTQGEYTDLCRGPHVPNTNYLGSFQLKDVSGAYWKNDKNNKMLQRISGYAFSSKDELENYLNFLKEVEKRDHRKLGKELGLFMLSDYAPGATFFLPKGMIIRNLLEETIKGETKEGYQQVKTPTIMSSKLWEISGHWNYYKENMFITDAENEPYAVKPMNCPGAMLIFKNELRSYRDLPMRLTELGNVCRKELSGAVHGLMRTREFTQDDAHLFVTQDQMVDEVKNLIEIVDKLYSKIFDFKYSVELSTRPTSYIGDEKLWEEATISLKRALELKGLDYKVNEGDGAFYGPKIDFHIKDAIGRSWQCATIQLDFNFPIRFDLSYIGNDGEKHRPIVIHRAIYGSIERFMGILIEHYEGKFPFWLAPIQISILTISEKSKNYALALYEELKDKNIRVELNDDDVRIAQKIKRASQQKIPIQVIIGEKEAQENLVNIRILGKEHNSNLSREEFISKIVKKELI